MRGRPATEPAQRMLDPWKRCSMWIFRGDGTMVGCVGLRKLIKWTAIALAAMAIAEQLRRPSEDRTWEGTVVGFVPYDFRLLDDRASAKPLAEPRSQARLSRRRTFGVGLHDYFAQLVRLGLEPNRHQRGVEPIRIEPRGQTRRGLSSIRRDVGRRTHADRRRSRARADGAVGIGLPSDRPKRRDHLVQGVRAPSDLRGAVHGVPFGAMDNGHPGARARRRAQVAADGGRR